MNESYLCPEGNPHIGLDAKVYLQRTIGSDETHLVVTFEGIEERIVMKVNSLSVNHIMDTYPKVPLIVLIPEGTSDKAQSVVDFLTKFDFDSKTLKK